MKCLIVEREAMKIFAFVIIAFGMLLLLIPFIGWIPGLAFIFVGTMMLIASAIEKSKHP
jgi:hypothetical protein